MFSPDFTPGEGVGYTSVMSRESFVFVLGFVVFFTSFLGIPRDWKEYVFIGTGIVLMILGFHLRRTAFLRSIEDGSGERRSEAFVEGAKVSEKPRISPFANPERMIE